MSTTVHSFEVRDVALERVLIYTDRAEITRLLKVTLAPGLNEVLFENVSNNFIHDSVRVNGRGEAVIHEVNFREKPALREEADSPKVKEVTTRLEAKEKEKKEIEDQKKVIEKRIEVLDQVFGQVGNSVVRPPPDATGTSVVRLDDSSLDQLTNFFAYYNRNSLETRKEAHTIEEALNKINEEVQKIQRERDQLTNFHGYSRQFTVLLESEKGGEVELEVIYQVHGASWSPRYDIRVETGEKKALKVTYSGVVQQWTGEDWKEATLVLSTAQPALGGQIPELGTLEAVFYRPPPPPQPQQRMMMAGGFGGANVMRKSRAAPGAAEDMVLECAMAAPMAYSAVAVAEPAGEHSLATEFEIKREATIPSDSSEHKVSIGVVDAEPRLLHRSVPSKNKAVFLTASALNSSALPFLAGPAAVYLDGSFIANTQIKEVSPGERFSCSLGVDTAVRVDYKPAHKYNEQVGLLTKSANVVHEQRIVVKNTRSAGEPLLISILEHIPKSTDEKIRVRVLQPEAKPTEDKDSSVLPEPGAVLDKNNNLIWTVKVDPKAEKELVLKWSLEHPNNEKIEYRERF